MWSIRAYQIIFLVYLSDLQSSDRYKRGTFQKTNVTDEIGKMGKEAIIECKRYYGKSPNVNILQVSGDEHPEDIFMTFVPDHLRRIIYNLLNNALRATVENNANLSPVEVLISKGTENVCIKISDTGGGASLVEQGKWGAYLYHNPPKPPPKRKSKKHVTLQEGSIYFST